MHKMYPPRVMHAEYRLKLHQFNGKTCQAQAVPVVQCIICLPSCRFPSQDILTETRT